MHEDMLGLEISPSDIERTARFLAARYGEAAESVALSRVDAYEALGKLDAAAIWDLIRVEIRAVDPGGNGADLSRHFPADIWPRH